MRTTGIMYLIAILAGSIAGVRAQAPARQATVVVPKGAEEAWRLDNQRRAAQIAGDLTTLEALSADELTYSHTNGRVDTKKSFLAMLRSGARYEKIDLSEVQIAPFDSTVVITGLVRVAVKSPAGPTTFQARFTDVWAKQHDRWRFVAWHTTKVAD